MSSDEGETEKKLKSPDLGEGEAVKKRKFQIYGEDENGKKLKPRDLGEDEPLPKYVSPFSEKVLSYRPSWLKSPPPDAKRRRRLMSVDILDPRNLANKGPKRKQALLLKQFEDLKTKIENGPRESKPVFIDESAVPVKVTPAMCIFHTTESRIRVLKRIGVLRGSTHPKESEEYAWGQRLTTVLEIVHKVCKIQREVISMLCLSKLMHDNLISCMPLWEDLNFSGMNHAGDRLIAAFSNPRYHYVVNDLNLDNAKDIEDQHFTLIRKKFIAEESLQYIETLNLDRCPNISNTGVKEITHTCPAIMKFSICGNLRVTDYGIKALVKNLTSLTALKLSDCKNITNDSLVAIGSGCPFLESLDTTSCEQVTDAGVIAVAEGCPSLTSLDITRCEQVTDAGVIAVAEGCQNLTSLSLSGITGVTDKCLETLSQKVSKTLKTLDVNHCSGMKTRSEDQLRLLFPELKCFSRS